MRVWVYISIMHTAHAHARAHTHTHIHTHTHTYTHTHTPYLAYYRFVQVHVATCGVSLQQILPSP